MSGRAWKIFASVILVLLLTSGGVFYWQNQQDVKILNEDLRSGVKVTKNIAGEYKIINKLDGYELEIPKDWRGLKEINYIPSKKQEKYFVTSINMKGNGKKSGGIGVDCFRIGKDSFELKNEVEQIFQEYGLSGDFITQTIESINIIKIKEDTHLRGEYVYFLKKPPKIYAVTGPSEKSIQDIILSGKW